jgi:hypothetical protein
MRRSFFMSRDWNRFGACLALVVLGCDSSGQSNVKDNADSGNHSGGGAQGDGGAAGVAGTPNGGGAAGAQGNGSGGKTSAGGGQSSGGNAGSKGGTTSAGAQGSGGAAGGSAGSSGATGGRAGNGGAAGGSAGSGGMQQPPPPKVSACDGLAADGTFEEITPPEVKAAIATGTDAGTFAIAVDSVNQGTVYAGTLYHKLWKSTDCGATWKAIATGTNGADVNRGMNWTLFIDPQDPAVVYTNSGYGSNGLFKSLDGGVNWIDIWSLKSQPELGKSFQYNFANVIAIDPSNHLHILLTFHEPCLAPHAATCIVETMNGGTTWSIIDGQPGWDGNEGQVIFFLNDSKTWLWGSQSNGFWRTGDSGQSWQAISGMTTSHLQSSELVRTKNGTFFVAGSDGIWRSPDGAVSTWKLVPDTGPIVGGLVTDGTNMYASTCYFQNFCTPRYLKSPESDGQKWTVMPSPSTMTMGGTMGYDAGHHLLYSSNLNSGMWRVVVH